MDLEKAISNSLLECLEFSDKVMEKAEADRQEMSSLIQQIIEKDKKGEDCKELIDKQRSLVAVSYLLNDDLSKKISETASLYKIAKVQGIELGFSEIQMRRLEASLKNQVNHFALSKGEIVAKDNSLMDKIADRIATQETFTHEDFLKNLRKTPLYGKETN